MVYVSTVHACLHGRKEADSPDREHGVEGICERSIERETVSGFRSKGARSSCAETTVAVAGAGLTNALEGGVAEMPDGLGHDVVPRHVHVLHHRHHQRHHVQRREGAHLH